MYSVLPAERVDRLRVGVGRGVHGDVAALRRRRRGTGCRRGRQTTFGPVSDGLGGRRGGRRWRCCRRRRGSARARRRRRRASTHDRDDDRGTASGWTCRRRSARVTVSDIGGCYRSSRATAGAAQPVDGCGQPAGLGAGSSRSCWSASSGISERGAGAGRAARRRPRRWRRGHGRGTAHRLVDDLGELSRLVHVHDLHGYRSTYRAPGFVPVSPRHVTGVDT